jgi:hypothetical protein
VSLHCESKLLCWHTGHQGGFLAGPPAPGFLMPPHAVLLAKVSDTSLQPVRLAAGLVALKFTNCGSRAVRCLEGACYLCESLYPFESALHKTNLPQGITRHGIVLDAKSWSQYTQNACHPRQGAQDAPSYSSVLIWNKGEQLDLSDEQCHAYVLIKASLLGEKYLPASLSGISTR